MKILHVIESLGRGGAERRLLNDLTYLRSSDFEHRVCHLGPDAVLAPELAALGISVEWLGLRRLSEWRTALARLRRLVDRERPDLIHSQLFWADCYARIIARQTGIPSVVTLQSSAFKPREFLYSRKRHAAEWVMSRWSDCHYVAVSAYVREAVIRHLRLPPERVELIYNSVDLERFRPVEPARRMGMRQAMGFEATHQVLLMVGRLDPPKGHRMLFEAARRIRSQWPGLRVLIVGRGPLETELRRAVRGLDLEGAVHFLGDRHDIPDLLAVCDLYVFPTKCEGLPLTLLEAMAMARPCVASRIGPIEEIIVPNSRTGYLVETSRPEAWAAAISAVLRDPHLEEGARRGREVIAQRFSASGQAAKLGAVYRRMVNARASGDLQAPQEQLVHAAA